MELPPEKDEMGEEVPMDPQVEARLAPMLAQAAQRLLQNNQAEAQQQQAQQMQQDPIIQMQQQELQLKAQEQERKAAKDATDAQFKAEQLKLDQARITVDAAKATAQQKADLLKTAAQIDAAKQQATNKLVVDGMKQISSQNFNKQMKQQENIQRNLQAAMATRQNKPTKGE
jgi:hypothetical protein